MSESAGLKYTLLASTLLIVVGGHLGFLQWIASGTEIPSGCQFDGAKNYTRAAQKACRVNCGQCDRLLDLLRATVVASSMDQMCRTLELLTGTPGGHSEAFDPRVTVRRIQNRFDQNYRAAGGFRNIHVNIALNRPGGPANSEFRVGPPTSRNYRGDSGNGTGGRHQTAVHVQLLLDHC